eukprot:TRINITY_DN50548_c0_g2_i3.p1 TRINITY_DN50548_c0_g2~~TRINITY_DN50548_c0_g2_i3.p1  ORF type:complete len:545 (+),score=119.14 TRINITY_DN50548_c0_g2_i3:414-2048(+)
MRNLTAVMTMQFRQTVLKHCESRGDSWAKNVRGKIEFESDCIASETVYHNVCYTNFRSKRCQIPMIFRDDQPVIKKACVGRPEDSVRFEAFKQTIQYLDSLDDDQVTVHDLVDFMQDMLKNTKNDAYSVPHMKVKQLGVQLPEDVVFVIDGGSLLHRLSWPRGTRYNQLVQMYISFISRNYNRGIVVFDGYSSGPSTKDVAHLRRNGGVTGPFIAFAGDMVLTESKERFLANPANKQRFIHLLSQALVKSGFDSLHARGDADCLIVQTTLEKAKETETVLIGEDTDLLILLLHHITEEHHPVYFKSSSAKSASTAKVWDLKLAREGLGAEVCRGILFAHAIGGCDTTSSLFSVGKSLPLKKLLQSASFQKQACVFITPNNNQEQIAAAGETALTVLYGGKDTDSLDKLRHVRYMQKIATSVVSLHPKKLPPTSSAAKFHSMRTYFQVQEWLHLSQDSCHLEPQDWGWEVQNGVMFPVLNDIDVAPEALLHVVRCNCVTECQTARCTCRKHGLVCSVACGQCRGQSCTNSVRVAEAAGLSDEEDT